MPIVKVTDLAYGRLQSPSLDEAEEFLTHFGMVRAESTPDALYMRGPDPDHHLNVTNLGPTIFIGTVVIMTQNAKEKTRLYREMLGFLCSDDVYAGSKDNVIASFNRCDRGKTFVDHHVFLCLEGPKVGLNHLSFEVQSIDDVMLGHEIGRASCRGRV